MCVGVGGGGGEGAKALAGVLTDNNTLTELTPRGGGLGSERVEALSMHSW